MVILQYNIILKQVIKKRNLTIKNVYICLGMDMTVKSIVSKESSKINNLMKVACLQTRFYDFRLRL